MCGIVGIYRYDDRREEARFYVDLVNSLYHRGPDGGGYWADGPFFLGHRRLSIIDLVTGDQPMGLTEGDLVISFNGEIYNYLELREELLAQVTYLLQLPIRKYCCTGIVSGARVYPPT